MPQFEMTGKENPKFEALPLFVQAYIEAAFWTEEERLTEEMGAEMPGVLFNRATAETSFSGPSASSFEMLAPEALESIITDCTAFETANKADLEQAGDDAQNGHDFWLTRNGHGVGFWDRGYPEALGDKLTTACKKYGESSLYIGDDGKIYTE